MPATAGEELYDLFVSYAHADNEALMGAPHGWVTTMAENLDKVLRRKLGREGADLWMDHLLESNQQVSNTLREHRVTRSRTLLPVISPRYRRSDWCRQELADFTTAAAAEGRTHCIFPIEVEPVDRMSLPQALHDLIPIAFWDNSFGSPEPRLLGFPQPQIDGDALSWARINKLAHQIAGRLTQQDPPAAAASALLPMPQQLFAPPSMPLASPASTPDPTADASAVAAGEHLQIHIHAAPEDRASAEQIAERLEAANVSTLMTLPPQPGQTYLDCLREQQDSLSLSNGLLLLQGLGPVMNLQVAFQMALRAFGVRRPGIWSAALNLLPADKPPVPIRSPSLMHLACSDGGFSIAQLTPFFRALRAGGSTSSAAAPGHV